MSQKKSTSVQVHSIKLIYFQSNFTFSFSDINRLNQFVWTFHRYKKYVYFNRCGFDWGWTFWADASWKRRKKKKLVLRICTYVLLLTISRRLRSSCDVRVSLFNEDDKKESPLIYLFISFAVRNDAVRWAHWSIAFHKKWEIFFVCVFGRYGYETMRRVKFSQRKCIEEMTKR